MSCNFLQQKMQIRAALVVVPWCKNGAGNNGNTGLGSSASFTVSGCDPGGPGDACSGSGLVCPGSCNPNPALCDTSKFPSTTNLFGTAKRAGCYGSVDGNFVGAWYCETEDGGFTEPCCADNIFTTFQSYTGDTMIEGEGYFPPILHTEVLDPATCLSSLDGAAKTLNGAIAGCASGLQNPSPRGLANTLLAEIDLSTMPWDTYSITAPPLDPSTPGAWLAQPAVTTIYEVNPGSLPAFLLAGANLSNEHCWATGYLYADIFAANGQFQPYITEAGVEVGSFFVNPAGYEWACSKVEIIIQGCNMFCCLKAWSSSCVAASNDCLGINGGGGGTTGACFIGAPTCPTDDSTTTVSVGGLISLSVSADTIGWSMAHIWSNEGAGCSDDHHTTTLTDGTTDKCCPP